MCQSQDSLDLFSTALHRQFKSNMQTIQSIMYKFKVMIEDLNLTFLQVNMSPSNSAERLISWEPPSKGCMKLDADASVKSDHSSAAIGRVLRNAVAGWIRGFEGKLGRCFINAMELCTIKEGLKMARDKKMPWIKCETDSQIATLLLKLKESRMLIRRPWKCEILHKLREGNGVTDGLANCGHVCNSRLVMLDEPPMDILPLLKDDLEAVSFRYS